MPFLDNHDRQRIAEQVPDASLRRVAFAYLLTTRGMPQLYAGDEIAMKGGDDPDNRRDFPGGFPGDAQDAFTQAGRTAEQQAEFAWISALTKLRREHAALECGGEQVLAANADWLVTLRDMGHQRVERCEGKSGGASRRRASCCGAASREWRGDAGCADEGDVGAGMQNVAAAAGRRAGEYIGRRNSSESEWE